MRGEEDMPEFPLVTEKEDIHLACKLKALNSNNG